MGINLLGILDLFLLVAFSFWWMHSLIRRIVFTPSAFIVERYIWPSKKFIYTDVIDIGISKIKTRKGNIVFWGMNNRIEIVNLFMQLIEHGKIRPHQIQHKILLQESIHYKIIIPSLVISFILWCAVLYLWQYRFSDLVNLLILPLSFAPFFLIVYYMVYWITKRRLKNKSKAG